MVSYRRQTSYPPEEIPNDKSNSRRKKGMKGGKGDFYLNLTYSDSSMKDTPQLN